MVPDKEKAWKAIGSPTPMAVKSPERTSFNVDDFFIIFPPKIKNTTKQMLPLRKHMPSWHNYNTLK